MIIRDSGLLFWATLYISRRSRHPHRCSLRTIAVSTRCHFS